MRYLIIASIFLLGSAYAIVGEYTDNNSESICKINFEVPCPEDKSKYCSGICSATYLGKNKILSAEHCRHSIQWSRKTSLQCPGSDVVKIEKDYEFPDRFFDYSQDIALFSLERAPKNLKTGKEVKAMRVVKNDEEMKALLVNPASCFIAGYGLDNEEKYGELKTAKVKGIQHEKVERTSNGITFYSVPEQIKLRENYVKSGDSGGPMYCKDKNGDFVLVAVNQGSTKGLDLSFAEKLGKSSEWIHFHLGPFADEPEVYEEYKHQFRICDSVQYCIGELKKMSEASKDILKVVEALLIELSKENIAYSEVLKSKDSSEALSRLKAINDLWGKAHKQCFGELYK